MVSIPQGFAGGQSFLLRYLRQSVQEGDDMPEHLAKPSQVHTTLTPEAPVAPPPQEARRVGRSKTRVALAFLVAAASDIVSYGTVFMPPIQWAVDLTTALLLFIILGWQWALLPGLVVEAIPGLAAFPVWTMVVAAVALWGRIT